jgi:regulator of cell morphogenesis and NO signaling
MPRLTALIGKIASVHGRRHPELEDVTKVWADIRSDLEPHLIKEERELFPMIRELITAHTAPELHCGTLRNPIDVMLREHDSVGKLLARLRRITCDYRVPDDGCASYTACYRALEDLERDTHLHIHKENNVLFPAVVRMEHELIGPAAG